MNTDNQDLTTAPDTVTQAIAAARTRGQIERAMRMAASFDFETASKQSLHNDLIARMAKVLPAWMIEYIQPEPTIDYDMALEFVMVRLPGCCPITIVYSSSSGKIDGIEARTPLRLEWDEEWWVRLGHTRCLSLDEAIDVAAENGESYHAMEAEAARRNAEGASPEPQLPEPEQDNVDKLAELLAKYVSGQAITQRDDATTLIASGLFAIADQLRRIADAQEAQ